MLTRRRFLQALGLGVLGSATAACSPAVDFATRPNPATNRTPAPSNIVHLLNRTTFGATAADVATVTDIGVDAWIAAQLNPTEIDDTETQMLRLRRYDTLSMKARDLRAFGRLPDKRHVANELAAAALVRAVYSKRQLYEVMVDFWTDHLSIYHFKPDVTVFKTVDDREVIRPHALGSFRDMLTASAHSPAMLVYLDNVINEKQHPNENYAREIMELHTLGVDGGYTETDVLEVARCFTGWSVGDNGEFEYKPEWHDDGEKVVLGHTIPAGGGKSDGDRVLEILLAHPSTARYICTKLVRRFIADEPPTSAVETCVKTWTATDGDIAGVMNTLLMTPEFWNATARFKRPFELVASALRVTGATYNGAPNVLDTLERMGQRPFNWSTPDGYPDTADAWRGSLVARWNFVLSLVINGEIEGVNLPIPRLTQASRQSLDDPITFFADLLLNRRLTPAEREAVVRVLDDPNPQPSQQTTRNVIGAVMISPAFQRR